MLSNSIISISLCIKYGRDENDDKVNGRSIRIFNSLGFRKKI